MSANEIHQNDVGTVFKATIKDGASAIDVSSATVLRMVFTKPETTKLTKDASFYTNGSDGIITYTSVSGDLNEIGTWKCQGYIEMSSGKWSSDIKKFKVHRNL